MIVINKSDLIGAFEMNFDDMPSYLDTRTGELVIRQEDVRDDADAPAWQREQSALNKAIEDDTEGRFRLIEPPDSNEVFRWMEEFVGTVSDRKPREQLIRALNGPKPFRPFKDILRDTPGPEGDRYYAFHEAKVEAYAKEWLESLGVEWRWAEVSP